MIEISLGKLVLLALVALIVLGPEKLPGAARTAGALLRRIRTGWDSVRAEVERELEIEEIKRTARDAAMSADAVKADVKATMSEVREPFTQAAAEISPKAIVGSFTSTSSGTATTDVSTVAPSTHVVPEHAVPDHAVLDHVEPLHADPDQLELKHPDFDVSRATSKESTHGDA